jgi:hypothetical protein
MSIWLRMAGFTQRKSDEVFSFYAILFEKIKASELAEKKT